MPSRTKLSGQLALLFSLFWTGCFPGPDSDNLIECWLPGGYSVQQPKEPPGYWLFSPGASMSDHPIRRIGWTNTWILIEETRKTPPGADWSVIEASASHVQGPLEWDAVLRNPVWREIEVAAPQKACWQVSSR